ncbi:hypothetical protein Aph02nite_76670 [Actinoplanes philippinensis]|uniref:hypothetical protein n=1 Tax=Actinoplanes philippinensis TaxID=35752 RepID=UPI0011604D87|nr:hypothetical protein [Actinoplanes philippinensis]GIE81717.1 hypothetical protein Aph02nite_76670 [Actinoplanes philippinensis]
MYLADYTRLSRSCNEGNSGFTSFKYHPDVLELQWPDDVLEQWLYDHAANESFLDDYGAIDLSRLQWKVEAVSVEDFVQMPTGPSDDGYIDEIAENPDHWIGNRNMGVHEGVALCWQIHGTWKRWPILLHRSVLKSSGTGLQVVEGRTRVGILKGRHLKGDLVAANHLAWVGRLRK